MSVSLEMDDQPESSEAGPSRPSSNELRLGRRVLELEKERDALSAQVEALNLLTSSTVIPVSENPHLNQPGPITIPHDLIPTLSLLRSHINDLTRDSEALRYTFLASSLARQTQLGQPARPSTSQVRSPGGRVDVSMTPTPTTAELPTVDPLDVNPTRRSDTGGVDLAEVAKRVRDLVLENEELGEMVLDAGRSVESEWQILIDDAKQVIESLESDLEHHASVVEKQKAVIQKYKAELESLRSGPPAKPRHSETSSHSRDAHDASTSRSHRSQTAESKQSGRSRDDRRPSSRHANDGRLESERNKDKEKDRQRERERDEERRVSRRDSERRQSEGKGKDRDGGMTLDDPPTSSAPLEAVSVPQEPTRTVGLSIKGLHQRQSGDTPAQPPRDPNGENRVDDRSWKRRR